MCVCVCGVVGVSRVPVVAMVVGWVRLFPLSFSPIPLLSLGL